MRNFFKKGITFALAFTLVVTMCFGSVGTAKVYAADTTEEIALSVYDGDKLVKKYTLEDLWDIAKSEGDIKYKFSGYNRNPSFYTFGDENAYASVKKVVGPTVTGILEDAGVTYNDDQLISFAGADGLVESFIAEDFFKERYYFPKGRIEKKGDGYTGTPAQEANYADAEPVVPIIDLNRRFDDPATDKNEDEHESVLRFGQTAPNEQNNAAFVKYVADGGSIIVGDVQKAAWEPIQSANYNSGVILPETEIIFDMPDSLIGKKVAAYYTTDGKEPGHGDAIYNYNKYGDFHKIILPEDEGTVTYTFKTIGYGKLDSEVTTFTYEVKDVASPAKPSGFTVTAEDSREAVLRWTPVQDADGYEVLKRNPETDKYEVLHVVDDSSADTFIDAAIATGVEYSYQVRAFKKLSSGQTVYGSATAKQSVVIPDLNSPELSSAESSGYGSVQIKWREAKGVDGYEIYRYDAATGTYKLIKDITDGSVTQFKNTGLKTGTKYSYKVRSYLYLITEEKIYSEFSNVKSATPVLGKPVLKSVSKTGYAGIQVTWGKVAGASGYQVWRYDAASKKYALVKTITSGSTVSWKNTGLKTGRKYTYKVKAYRTVDGKKVFSAYSGTKAATPALNKPVISKLTPGKNAITVKWKQVPGANGYKIYRSTAKNGKYTCVKTIKKGGILSWKNTKLKNGKRYYYKVKAYRIVDKKYVYSSISSVKYIKSK